MGVKVGINPEPSLPHYSARSSGSVRPIRRSCCTLTSAM
jgi:tubulin alpha